MQHTDHKRQSLTDMQWGHLVSLRGGPRSSYPHLSLGTLQSLKRRKLVVAHRGIGSIASPRTHIKWELTVLGRAVLKMERH